MESWKQYISNVYKELRSAPLTEVVPTFTAESIKPRGMQLRNGKIVGHIIEKKLCNHTRCALWCKKELCCCYCADKRPINQSYIAYNGSNLADITYVERSYHYCASCKNGSKSKIRTPVIKTTQQMLDEALDTITNLNKKLNDANSEINSLKSEIIAMKKTISKKNEKIKEYEEKLTEKELYDSSMNLYESGMGDLQMHLGFTSDVIGDCWIDHYYSDGISGLKKKLYDSSKYKGHENCAECKSIIKGIHD